MKLEMRFKLELSNPLLVATHGPLSITALKGPGKHKDPTNHSFENRPYLELMIFWTPEHSLADSRDSDQQS